MRPPAFASLLLGAGLSAACGGHGSHNGKEWTKEELRELEVKWGDEVRAAPPAPGRPAMLMPAGSGASRASDPLRTSSTQSA